MRAIDAEVTRRANEAVGRAGIARVSPIHGRLMAELDPEGTRPTLLALRLGITKAAVGQLLARLESRGLVERSTDPADGRAVIVRPTDKARKAFSIAREVIAAIEDEWREELGSRSMAAFERDLIALEKSVGRS